MATAAPLSDSLGVALLLRWCDAALDGLAAAREEIDALNVYPVPDGDTGTNLYLTFEAARAAMVATQPASPVASLTAFARGALLGARGNSGVILSQLLRAGADQLMRGDLSSPGRLLADTLTLAADAAYAAVADPVEGTILTVARAASDGAQAAVAEAPSQPTAQMGHVVRAAAREAREALDRTRDQLEVLRLAGVVDAGGRGLCVLLDAAEEVLTGVRPVGGYASVAPRSIPERLAVDLDSAGPAYEVMFLLDAQDAAVPGLRRALARLGDSLVVVGGDGLWNVHVHVDDAGAAIEAAIDAGRPHRIRVTSFAEQRGRSPGRSPTSRTSRRAVVATAAGPGLAGLFEAAGAVALRAGPRRRSSTGEVLEAIRSTGCEEVVVLPNDSDTIAVAEAAASVARDEGVRVAVVPTRAQVQGLAAVAVHDITRSFDDDVVSMTAAAGHARSGAVTVAARDAMTMAGPCRTGDVLGVVDGDFVVVGTSLADVAVAVLDRLLSAGGEMVTLVRGDGCDDDLAAEVTAEVERRRPEVEVVVYDGGQARYPLLIGVE